MNVSVTHIPDGAPHGGLYAVLSALHIPYEEISHAPVRTVAEAQAIKTRIAGTGCKNLLLTDARQEVFVLVLLEEHKRADLKAIARALDTPRLLADTLQRAGITDVGILQQAIKGNRLLDDGAGLLGMAYGEAMVDRFARDALEQPGVKRIFLKVGVNDIVHPNCESLKDEARAVTADEMIAGYQSLIAQAHARGIEVYLFTRTAWKGYTRNVLGSDDIQWSQEIDQMRQEINAWIRSADNPADGYIDLDFLCADEAATGLKSEYTTDGAHFTRAGQQAVVGAIPLTYFQ